MDSPGKSWINHITVWLTAFAATAYGSGFIIITTFLDRIGVHEIGSDFFRIKYIVVGTLFLLVFLTLVVPMLAMLYLVGGRFQDAEVISCKSAPTATPEQDHNAYVMMIVLITHLLLFFYAFAAFAPPQFFFVQRWWVLASVTVHIIVVPILLRWLIPLVIVAKWRRGAAELLRAVALLAVLTLDVFAFSPDLWTTLASMLECGGYMCLMFVALTDILAWRIGRRLQSITNENSRIAWAVTGGCLLLGLYFLTVLSFAIRVYPYIPSGKGGGDYTNASSIVMVFREVNRLAIPVEVLDAPSQHERATELSSPQNSAATQPRHDMYRSIPLLVIEEGANDFYLANPNDLGGPATWRTGAKRPTIFRIPKEMVGSVTQ